MFVNLDSLTDHQLVLFNNKRAEAVEIYNKISSKLLDEAPDDIAWLTNNVTSRDTSWSKLLYYINCLIFLDAMKKEESIDKIATCDPFLSHYLSQWHQVECNNSYFFYRVKSSIKNIYHHLFNILRSCLCMYSKSSKRLGVITQLKRVTLVDTFIASKMASYKDRYYNNIVETGTLGNCCYLINYLPTPHRSELNRIAKNTPVPVLFFFDLLKTNDYIFAFRKTIQGKRQLSKSYYVKDYDINGLLYECAANSTHFYYFLSLLYYRLPKRIFDYNIDLKILIDWYENQGYDRSLYFSFNELNRNEYIRGFLGHIPDITYWPHRIATSAECIHNIAPKVLFVGNKCLYDTYAESQYPGELFLAPLFRAQKVWHIGRNETKKPILTVLAPLGIDDYETTIKVDFIVNFIRESRCANVKFVIKPHPNYPLNKITQMTKDFDGIDIGQGDIYNYLPDTDAVIGANTTVMYEALAMGIPVLNIIDQRGRIQLSRPMRTPDILWYDINNNMEMNDSINAISNHDISQLISYGNIIKDYYFERETEDKISKLFEC